MSPMFKCFLCENPKATAEPNGGAFVVTCQVCGKYSITEEAVLFVGASKVPCHLVSGLVRNYWEVAKAPFEVRSDMLQSMESFMQMSSLAIPPDHDVPRKADLILRHLQRKSTYPGNVIALPAKQSYSIGFCNNENEFVFCRKYLLDLKLIEYVPPPVKDRNGFDYRITPSGWAYLSGIGADAKDQGFIAMAFSLPTSNVLHTDGLIPGIKTAGYNPMRIDRKDHNNRIEDEIVAEIRKSKFVVADLTGKNAGAYFEAGFAMGLGKPVIWTCQQSEIDAGNVHFDTRQYSIVSWEPDKLADFATRLTQRIEATIGRGRYIKETVA